MVAALFCARMVAAQDSTAVACNGQIIDHVVINATAPTVAMLRKTPVLARAAAAIHTTTRIDVISRFLLLHEGDRCDELRRAESERILRAQPFIAEALVRALPNGDGTVDLDVRTSDEVALVLGVAASTHAPNFRFVRLGDANVAGEGVYVAGDWRDGGTGFRDGFGGRVVDNQFLGYPYTFAADAHVTPLGSDWNVGATHPFYSDIQHGAWRARAGANDDYVQFRNDDNSSHALRLTRSYFDAGGLFRVGPPGHLGLFGASITGDEELPGTEQVLVTTHGLAPDPSSELLGRYTDHRIRRVNALLGFRNISFVTVRGLDALSGTQDLPIGLQAGALLGRGLSLLGSQGSDVFVSSDLYFGAIARNNAIRVQFQSETRHDNDSDAWDGILFSSRALEYFKPTAAQTTSISLEFSGGWRQRIPFNLSFSDPEGGLRGFSTSNTPGGQRAVVRLDHRAFLGRPYNLGDFGVGGFADFGRLWAGNIPYGVTTPVRGSIGVSLLAAVPPRSARLWRVDLAYAVSREPGSHRFELRLTNTDKTTFFLPEPSDIAATRERTVPSSVFRWPQ